MNCSKNFRRNWGDMGIGRVWGKEGGKHIKTALMYEIFKNTNNKIKSHEIVHPFTLGHSPPIILTLLSLPGPQVLHVT